ncbi:peptide/nickel transport system ATP-binding protein [Humitalea rosea]|uniref:Peptide/nickel transport system ATP-binding protein n=1 Tax=Humitalea rosea TaxID=990373 RepID=A0A2W7HWG7_9PROT|nr:ABC transporter ATP-binding protein [Humitalea rosea]PZW37695.1 peptide/nickel transport system ATP-binding protein [Humitalea rosea]
MNAEPMLAMSPEPATLDVTGLSITYGAGPQGLKAVRDVSFRIAPGEAYGLIGESGSGKSTIAYAVLRHVPAGTVSGRILLNGQDVMAMSPQTLAGIRGRVVSMIYQDPMSALNPAIRVGEQIAEVIRQHRRGDRASAWARSVALLGQVQLPLPAEIAHRYPHQLSGGQQQRVVIAMALACDPELLVMDEPTTGLDVTTEAVILDLINDLRHALGVAVLFISHNMGVVAQVCDRVGVLYAGQLVEEGSTAQVLRAPRHPYTIGLMNALPTIDRAADRLVDIPGRLPDLRVVPPGCVFAPRCAAVQDICHAVMPTLEPVGTGHDSRCHERDRLERLLPAVAPATASDAPLPAKADGGRPLLQIVGIERSFGRAPMLALPFLRRRTPVRAVDDVTLDIAPGQTLAVVGESGSGKSTLARCVAGLLRPDRGDIRLENQVLSPLVQQRTRPQQRALQFIFQNPDAALNPHWTVERIVGRPLQLYGGIARGAALRARVVALLEATKLGERYLERYPHEMSGGEKQRVSIARAFAGDPRLVVCDEPTSALDISVQAAILNQLRDLQQRHGTSYLFISHDLGVVRHIAHRVAIMRHGRIVEAGTPAQVFGAPQHPYTQALIAAIPTLEPKRLRDGTAGRLRTADGMIDA